MWAQTWGNIDDLVLPYTGKTSVDVTPEMLKQVSEGFCLNMGLHDFVTCIDRATHLKRCLTNPKSSSPRWVYCRHRPNSGKSPSLKNSPGKRWCATLQLGIFAMERISVSSSVLASTWKTLSPSTTKWDTFNTFYNIKIFLSFTAKAPIRVDFAFIFVVWDRDNVGPFSGFHEAVGDTLALSVQTTKQ